MKKTADHLHILVWRSRFTSEKRMERIERRGFHCNEARKYCLFMCTQSFLIHYIFSHTVSTSKRVKIDCFPRARKYIINRKYIIFIIFHLYLVQFIIIIIIFNNIFIKIVQKTYNHTKNNKFSISRCWKFIKKKHLFSTSFLRTLDYAHELINTVKMIFSMRSIISINLSFKKWVQKKNHLDPNE